MNGVLLLPEDILRLLIYYLQPIEAFQFMATCTQLWSRIDTSPIKSFSDHRYKIETQQLCNDQKIDPSWKFGTSTFQHQYNDLKKNSDSRNDDFICIFRHEWSKAQPRDVRRWNKLIGPLRSIRLETSLTSAIEQPTELNFLFEELSPYLQSVDIHLYNRNHHKQQPSKFGCNAYLNLMNDDQMVITSSSSDLVDRISYTNSSQTTATESSTSTESLESIQEEQYGLGLVISSLSFDVKAPWGWESSNSSANRFYDWLDHMCYNIDAQSLLYLNFSFHLSLLSITRNITSRKTNQLIFPNVKKFRLAIGIPSSSMNLANAERRTPRISHRSNIQLVKKSSAVVHKLDWGLCHVLKGPSVVLSHIRLYQISLIPILTYSTSVQHIEIECILPEAIEALILVIKEYHLCVQRLPCLFLKVQKASILPGTPREKALNRCTKLQLNELINVLTAMGFSVSSIPYTSLVDFQNDCSPNDYSINEDFLSIKEDFQCINFFR